MTPVGAMIFFQASQYKPANLIDTWPSKIHLDHDWEAQNSWHQLAYTVGKVDHSIAWSGFT